MKIFEAQVEIDDLDNFLGRLDSIADSHNTTIQGFDARYVVSRRHIEEAVEKARRAFDRDENVARELGMEILLYAAGTRQIDVATEIGLSEGENHVVFVMVGGDTDDAVRELEELVGGTSEFETGDEDRIRDFFEITEAELDAVGEEKLGKLVLERVALLDVNK